MSRIYLLDDHQMLRDGLVGLLEAAGHSVVGQASDVSQALSDVLALRPDVLLLDLSLGEASGMVMLSELQVRQAPVRTIMLTMSSQVRDVKTALRLGALGYVLKGASSNELLRAIDAVASGGQYLGSEIWEMMQANPPEDEVDPFSALSVRERQIIELVVNGQSSAAIAGQLHLSPKTVETYRSRLMTKLGVHDVTSLVRLAVRHGLIDAAP